MITLLIALCFLRFLFIGMVRLKLQFAVLICVCVFHIYIYISITVFLIKFSQNTYYCNRSLISNMNSINYVLFPFVILLSSHQNLSIKMFVFGIPLLIPASQFQKLKILKYRY
jgi:hypothetical protein